MNTEQLSKANKLNERISYLGDFIDAHARNGNKGKKDSLLFARGNVPNGFWYSPLPEPFFEQVQKEIDSVREKMIVEMAREKLILEKEFSEILIKI